VGLALYEINAGVGKHQVWLRLWDTSAGWVGSLTGGEQPHVGGVVLAVPRPSLTGSGQSCDIWPITVPAHLDTEVALPLAKQLCIKLGVAVSLTCGIHIDHAGTEDIAQIRENCAEALMRFLAHLPRDLQT
jgi:hypothetical protein